MKGGRFVLGSIISLPFPIWFDNIETSHSEISRQNGNLINLKPFQLKNRKVIGRERETVYVLEDGILGEMETVVFGMERDFLKIETFLDRGIKRGYLREKGE